MIFAIDCKGNALQPKVGLQPAQTDALNRKGHHHEAIVCGKDCARMAHRQKAGVEGLRGIGRSFPAVQSRPRGEHHLFRRSIATLGTHAYDVTGCLGSSEVPVPLSKKPIIFVKTSDQISDHQIRLKGLNHSFFTLLI